MTRSRPVDRVIAVLKGAGYAQASDTLQVLTLQFEFHAVLVDARGSADLILIVDRVEDSDERALRRRIDAVARALDLAESRRSISLILVGPAPSEITISELSRICRVFRIGTPTGAGADDAVRAALAVLLPLDVQQDQIASVQPLKRIESQLSASSVAQVQPLLDAASSGEAAVRDALRRWLSEELSREIS